MDVIKLAYHDGLLEAEKHKKAAAHIKYSIVKDVSEDRKAFAPKTLEEEITPSIEREGHGGIGNIISSYIFIVMRCFFLLGAILALKHCRF